MARQRRSRSRAVRGKPNYIWIASAGQMAIIENATAYDVLLMPADWSGTVTEQSATLERMLLNVTTDTRTEIGVPMTQNAAVYMSDANAAGGMDTLDISHYTDWPDWHMNHDRVLHEFRLEWSGQISMQPQMPVQYTQLPEPVMNFRARRTLRPDDTIALGVGGLFAAQQGEVYYINWFCRSLVKVGLR